MEKEAFYVFYNYGTVNELVAQHAGYKYTLDHGAVVFLKEMPTSQTWASFEATTGTYICTGCPTLEECLTQTQALSEDITLRLTEPEYIQKAQDLSRYVVSGAFESWSA